MAKRTTVSVNDTRASWASVRRGARLERDPDLYEIYITRELEPPSEPVLVERLGGILSVWEELLRNVGGLKGLRRVAGE